MVQRAHRRLEERPLSQGQETSSIARASDAAGDGRGDRAFRADQRRSRRGGVARRAGALLASGEANEAAAKREAAPRWPAESRPLLRQRPLRPNELINRFRPLHRLQPTTAAPGALGFETPRICVQINGADETDDGLPDWGRCQLVLFWGSDHAAPSLLWTRTNSPYDITESSSRG